MKQHQLKIFKVSDKPQLDNEEPIYLIREGNFFRTVFHPRGWSDQPDYTLEKNGKIYRTKHHPKGFSASPDYEFGKDMKLYPTPNHPDGKTGKPEYKMTD
ncbi:MAG: hypothetical protein GY710_00055 [Desulfobacteraceae bacterium]|nr:hypothetical protein [Desulfobacteraceae bacterium]